MLGPPCASSAGASTCHHAILRDSGKAARRIGYHPSSPTICISSMPPSASAPTGIEPPQALRAARVTRIHGRELTDDYGWLRDKDDPRVRAYLEAENAYTRAMMQPTEGFQDALYREMLARIKKTDMGVTYRYGEYDYYSRTEAGKDYP